MKINNYIDFISESNISIILEANINFSDRFVSILSKIKSPIAKQLSDLVGKEVDVNTNYIDLTDKDDTVAFTPDNRAKEIKYTYIGSLGDHIYDGLSRKAIQEGKLGIKKSKVPNSGQSGSARKISLNEIEDLYKAEGYWNKRYEDGLFVMVFKFIEDGEEYEVLINSNGLKSDIANLPKSEIKIGRFTKRILDKSGIKVSDKEIEEFVNQFRSRIEIEKDVFRLFEIVKGEDIRRWYHEDRYVSEAGGTLNGSCMKYPKCQKFFSIYVENPEQVSMIILKNEPGSIEVIDENTGETKIVVEETKIRGRAILWKDIKGRTFMDRVYFTKESDVELFKQYAIINGWLYKEKQENSESTTILLNGEAIEGKIIVKLDKNNFDYYPYMDTMKYYSHNGTISNSSTVGYDFYLEDTNGGNGTCDCCGGSGSFPCEECDNGRVGCDCDEGKVDCPDCDGSGKEPDDDGEPINCRECDGTGKVDCSECEGSGYFDCDRCDHGMVDCYECN